ncbi:Short chain dehydrogenase atnD [Apiospora hydei]|uniref:Short chain dehydrogenase atnD n=1 Tax=Apiospora hydei TaxID=1337664 RepID=A0ABR1V2K4_9PEZI
MLADTARRFPESRLRLVFVTSALASSVRDNLNSIRDNVFDGLNDQKKANMRNWLVRLYPPEKTGVVIGMINPGLCRTGLARYSTWHYRLYIDVMSVLLAARMAVTGEPDGSVRGRGRGGGAWEVSVGVRDQRVRVSSSGYSILRT